jgi:YgiT-type zinc finger domain-containing protein
MGAGIHQEETLMRCRVCGSVQAQTTTDLPFKLGEHTIVILKGLPTMQCERCAEYSLADATFARVEQLLARVDSGTELEIIAFAA